MTDQRHLTARGLVRHKALISAAEELFLAKGYAAATVDEIVAKAGGSKTNVYSQFGGKEGLFFEVVEHLSAEFISPLRQIDLGLAEPEVALAILARTLLRQLLKPRHIAFQRMILASSEQFPALMARWYEVGPRQSQAILARVLGSAGVAILFHDMIVTDPVNLAMMGQCPAWPEVEAHIDAAIAIILRAVA